MQVLTEKNTRMSQELEECKTQMRAAIAALQEQKKPPVGNILKNDGYHIMCGMVLRLELALVFPEEEGMMQQSSVSISLSF